MLPIAANIGLSALSGARSLWKYLVADLWRLAFAVAIIFAAYQTARINGVFWIDGLAEQVDRFEAEAKAAKARAIAAEKLADERMKQRQAENAQRSRQTQEAISNAANANPEDAGAAAGPVIDAAADSLRARAAARGSGRD